MAPKKAVKKLLLPLPDPVPFGSEDLFSDSNDQEDELMPESLEVIRSHNPKKKWRDAQLTFPANILHKMLVKRKIAPKVRREAAIYTAGVLEYLVAELVEISGEVTAINRKKRITPRHIMMAIKKDLEFDQLLKEVTFPDSGVIPHIEEVLLPSLTARQRQKKRSNSSSTSSVPTKMAKKSLLPVENLYDDSV